MCMFIASSTHDIHFTKSTMDYNEETQTLQVVMNVFTDDLELAIERSHEGLDLEIGSENQHEQVLIVKMYGPILSNSLGV